MPETLAPSHLSKSQLGALDACALKYWRRYVAKEKGPMSAKVAAGIGLHKAFARYYMAMKAGQTLPTAGDLWNIASAGWQEFESKSGLVYDEPPNNKEGLERDVREAIDCFICGLGPTLKPYAVELFAPVTIRYADVEQTIDSYIDLVLEQEGNPIIDWKFTQRFEPTREVRADQALYSMWHSAKFGVPNTKFMTVAFVRYKKGIEVKVDTFQVTPEAREFYIQHVVYPRLKQKQAGIWPANTANCSWCEFHNVTCFPQGAL